MIMSRWMSRWKLFRAWYHHLRGHGGRFYGHGPRYVPGYEPYSKFNCIRWAWSHSKTYNIDAWPHSRTHYIDGTDRCK